MDAVLRTVLLTMLSMVAFAGNSLLCRAALENTTIDAASFTAIRIVSGAACLLIVTAFAGSGRKSGGSWWSALALFAYAALFSYAYLGLSAATGALLLFGAVQITMITRGLYAGERFSSLQIVGLVLAIGGLVGLLLPGLSAPPPSAATLMLAAGVAWGCYSLRGQGAADPIAATTGNFLRSVPFALALVLFMRAGLELDALGVAYAVASGALTSGLGYSIWYAVLPALRATTAATVQLSVPAITAFGAVLLLGEAFSLRLLLASVTILGGIWLVIRFGERRNPGN
jgi:drug/metabolite transporter (DMT)-like permease